MSERFVRFRASGKQEIHYGRLENDQITALTAAPWLGGQPTSSSVPLTMQPSVHQWSRQRSFALV